MSPIQEQLPGYNCTFELLYLYYVYILQDSVVYRYLTLLHSVTASDGGTSGHELKHKAAIVMFKVGSQRCERNYAYTGVVYTQGTGSVLL